ncbi:pilus assembly protein PilX [Salmonella enterica subsp. enterica serovar Uganda]|uniref:type 4 pilus major pilin n=1 Tax=Citrobacter koseri TaxID=545 RepID=UPI001077EE54|nr:type 4 pilus major pilin [Citrobacter koseri]EAB3870738.1 pilus assembly protein PilX [Salmonella enterica]EAC1542150.1 pilus assembly protein PilX [Salmonella enterica subsp. enterica]EBO2751105.1 pilus assembly protein PilX [Salmonella enterica subsp. enterica serovar Agona]EDE1788998.1 pilus assembly protein PilX [Salmonella enterica subsp. enterica serovar Enteritidis]EEJ6011153.1 pilus assembly protein PilX [Salmonella enterica subsp. enterica serovar Meleagridis]EGC3413842.1 pilus as
MSLQSVSARRRISAKPDRGHVIVQNAAGILWTILGMVVVTVMVWSIWGMFNRSIETSNVQSIASAVKGNMKQQGKGYNFTSGTSMTGNMIQRGLAPGNMTIVGDKTSGSATLWNTWNGQVVIAPVAINGYNGGFSITYNKVPQEDCIDMSQKLAPVFTSLTVNSSVHNGEVTGESAGKECTKDSGGDGTNKLVFTYNG